LPGLKWLRAHLVLRHMPYVLRPCGVITAAGRALLPASPFMAFADALLWPGQAPPAGSSSPQHTKI
jgi:hypothetical protein